MKDFLAQSSPINLSRIFLPPSNRINHPGPTTDDNRQIATVNRQLSNNRPSSTISRPCQDSSTRDDESEARAFNARVLSGKLRSAVRTLTNRGSGGVKLPDDTCTKSGRPILDVIQEKHAPLRDPGDEIGWPDTPFEPYDAVPLPVPLLVTPDLVEVVASYLTGSAGPGGGLTQSPWPTGSSGTEKPRKASVGLLLPLAQSSPAVIRPGLPTERSELAGSSLWIRSLGHGQLGSVKHTANF
jgi:hypothetical protein